MHSQNRKAKFNKKKKKKEEKLLVSCVGYGQMEIEFPYKAMEDNST